MVEPHVFSVGVPRTGNQSLQKALGLLGYRVVGHDVHTLAELGGMSACVEVRFPIATIEAAFPGALYLWTERDEASWLQSMGRMRSFASDNWNPFWFLGGPEPSPGRLHAWARARSERLQDLLRLIPAERRLCFAVSDGWLPLCGFLNKPLPQRPFPRIDKYQYLGRAGA